MNDSDLKKELLLRLQDLEAPLSRVSSVCQEDQNREESRRTIPTNVFLTISRMNLELGLSIGSLDRLVHPSNRPKGEEQEKPLRGGEDGTSEQKSLFEQIWALKWYLTVDMRTLEEWKTEFKRMLDRSTSYKTAPPVIAGDLVRQATENLLEAKKLLNEYERNLPKSDTKQGPENDEE